MMPSTNKRSNRIEALENKLKRTLDQNEECRINQEIRSKKFDSLKFSHFYMDSNDIFHETFDDDKENIFDSNIRTK